MTLGAITERRGARQRALGRGARDARAAAAARRGWRRAASLWVAAERLARDAPALSAARRCSRRSRRRKATRRGRESPEEALRELLRARLGGLGPVTVDALVAQLGLPRGDIEFALAALQAEGTRVPGPRHAGPRRRRVVRAPPAGAHPSLHAEAAAARDRAGRAARLRALPVRVAARGGRVARQRPRGLAGRAGAARRLRGAGVAVGGRGAAGAREGLRVVVAGRPVHRGPHDVDAAAPAGQRRAGRRPLVAAHHAHPAAAAPRGADLVAAGRGGRGRRARWAAARNACSTSSSPTARRSSTRSPTARACCAPSWRTRWPSWWCAAAPTATATPACARCWCPRPSARRRRRARAGASRLFGIEDAGRWNVIRRAADARRRARPSARGDRARRAHAAAPLRRRLLPVAGARGRVAAAVARAGARLPPAGGARRDPRRPLHRGRDRRAVRAARRHRHDARRAPPAAGRHARVPVGVRPGQPAGHRARRPQGAARRRLARAVPRRPGHRHQRRGPDRAAGAAGSPREARAATRALALDPQVRFLEPAAVPFGEVGLPGA